ncbi:MAG: ion transporter [Bradymonadia bacterium]
MVKRSLIHRVFHGSGRLRDVTESIVSFLIAGSIVLLALELTAGPSDPVIREYEAIDTFLLWIFALEVCLRIGSFHPPRVDFFDEHYGRRLWLHISGRIRYCFTPWIIIDLVTILAFLPELRSLRALRLLRLLRGFKLFKYSNPFVRLSRALAENRLQFYMAFIMIGFTTVLGGLITSSIEVDHNPNMNSVADGLWWALVTVTTVGFGDIAPVSGLGRVVGGILMLIGMINLGLFASIVGHTLPAALMKLREEQFRMSRHINHWVVCGYEEGSEMFLRTLLNELDASQRVLLFGPGARPDSVPGDFEWIIGDPHKESELHKLRLEYATGVILIASRTVSPQQADAATILTAFTLRSYLNKYPVEHRQHPLFMVAEVLDDENSAHLYTAGVDEVVETNQLGFSLMSHAMTMHGTARVISRFASFGENSLFVGKWANMSEPMTFRAVCDTLRTQHQIMVVGVRQNEGEELINPQDDLIVQTEDALFYLGQNAVLMEE